MRKPYLLPIFLLLFICCSTEDTNKVNPEEVDELNKVAFEKMNAIRSGEKITGQIEFYYENGQKLSSGSFENGIKIGLHTEWHENGTIAEQGKLENGKREGEWIDYNEDGSEKKHTTYKYGNATD